MIEKVKEALDIIRQNSQKSYDSVFFTSSDGRHIMKEFESIYNDFLATYQLLINNDIAQEDDMKSPVLESAGDLSSEEPKVELPVVGLSSTQSLFEPAGDLSSEQPKVELPVVGLSSTQSLFEPAGDLSSEQPKAELPVVGLSSTQSLFEPAGDLSSEQPKADSTVVESTSSPSLFEPAGDLSEDTSKKASTDNGTKLPVVDPEDFTFHMKKDSIIPDLPISEDASQNFTAPSMTEEQIKASQRLLDSVPAVKETIDVDPIQAEINRLYDDFKSPAMSQDKSVSEQPKPTSNRKKVVKKSPYTWKEKIGNSVSKLRGILYKEGFGNRSKSYMRVCQLIANFRVNYRNISLEEADKGLETIDKAISSLGDLSFEEKKRLYRKLTRLVKAVERFNIQKENKASAAPSVGM